MKLGKCDLEYKNNKIAGLFVITALLFLCAMAGMRDSAVPVVLLKVNDIEIRQEENLPATTVEVVYDSKYGDICLDEGDGYTIKMLTDDLAAGEGYEVSSQTEYLEEGEFSLEIYLNDDIKEKLSNEWYGKVKFIVDSGHIVVKNKFGDWENDKFLKVDGTYASGWMNIGEDTYYFGEDGKKATGECEILGYKYYFNEDGKFDKEKNKMNPAHPMIALTFDDGPGKFTMKLLETLELYDARATFFMLGKQIPDYEEEVKKMAEIGCELANHTTNHARLTKLSGKDIQKEIKTTSNTISKYTDDRVLVRPPFGAVDSKVKKNVKHPLILWSVDTRDWEFKNTDKIVAYVMKHVEDGDVVLMHDIHEFSVEAAIEFIPKLIEEGYQFVTVSEMMQVRGIEMENGKIYSGARLK